MDMRKAAGAAAIVGGSIVTGLLFLARWKKALASPSGQYAPHR